MSYEAGSKECRHLIEAKESLLSAMESLSNINSTDILQIQIKEIYNKLELMHDNRKKIESATNIIMYNLSSLTVVLIVTFILSLYFLFKVTSN